MKSRDFRYLCLSAALNTIGYMGEQVALGWVVLDLTGSPFLVGAALGLRAAPGFFLGIVAGSISDILDRRDLMRLLNLAFVTTAVAVALLLVSGAARVWHLMLLAVVSGSIGALYQPVRQSFVYDVAGAGNALSGLAFLSLAMRIGQLVGSLAVGFLIARQGPWVAYVMMAGVYLLSAAALSRMARRSRLSAASRTPVLQSLREFGRELRANRALVALVVLVAAAEILGFSVSAVLPSLAVDVLKTDAEGLGYLNAARAVGAVIMVLAVSPFGEMRRQGAVFVGVLMAFGGGLALLGFAPSLAVATVIMGAVGGMMGLSDLFSQNLMQTIVPNALRGRAMGAWVVAIGTGPVGTFLVGALASAAGVTLALVGNGAGLAAIALLAALLYPRLRRL